MQHKKQIFFSQCIETHHHTNRHHPPKRAYPLLNCLPPIELLPRLELFTRFWIVKLFFLGSALLFSGESLPTKKGATN